MCIYTLKKQKKIKYLKNPQGGCATPPKKIKYLKNTKNNFFSNFFLFQYFLNI